MDRRFYFVTQSYFTRDGSREIYSGLQRYIRDLSRLVKSRNYECLILQKSDKPFLVEVEKGIQVQGIPAANRAYADFLFNIEAHRQIPEGAPVVYCLVDLAYPVVRKNSVAIQHGIWWDGEFSVWKRKLIRYVGQRAVRQCGAVICVDSNYINWALDAFDDYELTCKKCHYVPNFVNPEQFQVWEEKKEGTVPTVLYPRRCEHKRGAMLLYDACCRLWKKGMKFNTVFCGWGSLQQELSTAIARDGFADRVVVRDVHFDEMAKVYSDSDVVVIPTIRHEGTSLSCIEAMYMQKPVIVTNIGGLPNLVVPGFNGEVISPTCDELSNSLAKLLGDKDLRDTYAANARSVSKALTIDVWGDRVWSIVSSACGVN